MESIFRITIIEKTENGARYDAILDVNHPVFRGHFPGQPVVPGVFTLKMVKECVSDLLGHSVRYQTIKECKFLSAIIPGQHHQLEVTIGHKTENHQTNITAEISSKGEKMMKIKALMQ